MNRQSSFERNTRETQITGNINLDGTGKSEIKTGVGFLDHMIDQLAVHGKMDIMLECSGDLDVCAHHSIEDIAIAMGEAFRSALSDKKGIQRYASMYLPMDECLTRTVIDVSGRPYHVFIGEFKTPMIGDLPSEMIEHFFYSFAINAGITMHQEILYGSNDHHRVESLFKGLAHALRKAVSITGNKDEVLSTKGTL